MMGRWTNLVRTGGKQSISDLGVGGAHVELEAIGGLSDHLETALQDADGEAVCGLCGQPQPEVLQCTSLPPWNWTTCKMCAVLVLIAEMEVTLRRLASLFSAYRPCCEDA